MNEFRMQEYNTCSECGEAINVGDRVYAVSWDAVRAGRGICQLCAKSLLETADDPVRPSDVPTLSEETKAKITPQRRATKKKSES